MADITSMLISFSESIPNIEKLATGFGYILGVCFIFHALVQIHDLADRSTRQSVRGGHYAPVAYLLCGAALLYLPTSIDAFEATLFGSNSPLSYASNTTNFAQTTAEAITAVVQMAGLIWIVRGLALIAAASDPGFSDPHQKRGHGWRGTFFVIGGVLALNFTFTGEILQNTVQKFVSSPHYLYLIQQTVESML